MAGADEQVSWGGALWQTYLAVMWQVSSEPRVPLIAVSSTCLSRDHPSRPHVNHLSFWRVILTYVVTCWRRSGMSPSSSASPCMVVCVDERIVRDQRSRSWFLTYQLRTNESSEYLLHIKGASSDEQAANKWQVCMYLMCGRHACTYTASLPKVSVLSVLFKLLWWSMLTNKHNILPLQLLTVSRKKATLIFNITSPSVEIFFLQFFKAACSGIISAWCTLYIPMPSVIDVSLLNTWSDMTSVKLLFADAQCALTLDFISSDLWPLNSADFVMLCLQYSIMRKCTIHTGLALSVPTFYSTCRRPCRHAWSLPPGLQFLYN